MPMRAKVLRGGWDVKPTIARGSGGTGRAVTSASSAVVGNRWA